MTGPGGTQRRTLLKAFGGAAVGANVGAAPSGATATRAPAASRIVSDGLDIDAGAGPQEVLITYTNPEVRDRLDRLGVPHHAFDVVPVAYAELTGRQIRTVARWTGVPRLTENYDLVLLNDDSQEDTNAREVWEATELGYHGENVHVAVLDSGLDRTHPDLEPNVEANYQWVGNPRDPDPTMWVDVPGDADETGHGTLCAGSLGGTGEASPDQQYAGMAPEVSITGYNIVGLDSGVGVSGIVNAVVKPAANRAIGAYDHMLREQEAGSHDVQLVSNSWKWFRRNEDGVTAEDAQYDPWDPINVAVYTAFDQGILTHFGAGNAGPSKDTLRMTQAPFYLSVGATDADMEMAGFSSRGDPAGNHTRQTALENVERLYAEDLAVDEVDGPLALARPGLVAKGDGVTSAASLVGYHGKGSSTVNDPRYGTGGGTSLSCPTAAGCTALFLDAYYDEHGTFPTPVETINAMEATAREAAHESFETISAGAGYVDALTAIERTIDGDMPGFEDVELAGQP